LKIITDFVLGNLYNAYEINVLKGVKLLKKTVVFMILVVFLLTACTSSDETYWGLSATFTHDNNTLFGTKGKFGIIKTNGESNEPEFPVGQGRQYHVYFLDDIKDLNGKNQIFL